MDKNDTIIVVAHTEVDQYGNLLVTPEGGGDKVKISEKRHQLHPLFEQGKAIMLHWETYMNKPYVANAKLVEGELPSPPKLPGQDNKSTEISGQERGMWWKHKAFALSYAKDLVCAGSIDIKELYACAEKMLDWLNKPMV